MTAPQTVEDLIVAEYWTGSAWVQLDSAADVGALLRTRQAGTAAARAALTGAGEAFGDGQLRQPVLVATDKLHVTVSPQVGFLHQLTELDTLGIDKPETACKAYAK